MFDCPKELYVAGELKEKDFKGIAVIGSRRMTRYGESVVKSIVGDLVSTGVTIISGLAYGVDYEAQKIAYQLGGRSIGVLGSGLGKISPTSHINLAHSLVKDFQGALVSAYPSSMPAGKYTFIERDRLMAAMASAVLVIEAADKSGTSHTVNAALELGKEVFAVPGSIFSDFSVGCHKYIKQGANVVTCAQDIYDVMGDRWFPTSKNSKDTISMDLDFDTETEKKVYTSLDVYGINFDDLCKTLEIPASILLTTVTMLEFKGLIKIEGSTIFVVK